MQTNKASESTSLGIEYFPDVVIRATPKLSTMCEVARTVKYTMNSTGMTKGTLLRH